MEPTGKKLTPGAGKEVKAEAIVIATDADAPGHADAPRRGRGADQRPHRDA